MASVGQIFVQSFVKITEWVFIPPNIPQETKEQFQRKYWEMHCLELLMTLSIERLAVFKKVTR